MTTDTPLCVTIIRGIISKDGRSLANTKASRIKRKVKVALERAGYDVQTIRGIGIKFSHYGLKYREESHHLFGDFCGGDEMPNTAPRKSRGGKRSSRSKKSPLITGYHGPTSSLSDKEFAEEATKELPDNWEYASPNNARWMTFDITVTRKTGRSPSQVASYIVQEANKHLDLWDDVKFTILTINRTVMIGVSV